MMKSSRVLPSSSPVFLDSFVVCRDGLVTLLVSACLWILAIPLTVCLCDYVTLRNFSISLRLDFLIHTMDRSRRSSVRTGWEKTGEASKKIPVTIWGKISPKLHSSFTLHSEELNTQQRGGCYFSALLLEHENAHRLWISLPQNRDMGYSAHNYWSLSSWNITYLQFLRTN